MYLKNEYFQSNKTIFKLYQLNQSSGRRKIFKASFNKTYRLALEGPFFNTPV